MKKWIVLLAYFMPLALSAKELPLDHFIQQGDYLDMQMSPDGRHLAVRVSLINGF